MQGRVESLVVELALANGELRRQYEEKEALSERLSLLLKALPAGVVVLDSAARLPSDSRLLDEPGPILLVSGPNAPERHDLAGRVEQISVPAPGGRLQLARLAFALAQRGHNEVLVEAGALLAGSFIAAGLVDELIWYVAPKLLGAAARPALALPEPAALDEVESWRWHSVERFGDDLRLILRPPLPAPTWSWTAGER